jgi:hypothetical protein
VVLAIGHKGQARGPAVGDEKSGMGGVKHGGGSARVP